MSKNKETIMKVCITARGPTLESTFERHFARAPYFILYNTRTGTSEAIRNGFVISDARVGRNTVQLLKMNGLEAVITGEIGDNARTLLKGAGILLHMYTGPGRVKDAIDTVITTPVE
jgi:predicted Fe-Mo cluster-binding NifX family protein